MNHKAFAIVPIVAFIVVILFVGAAIAILTPTIANGKIRTKHIRSDAMGEGLPGLAGLPAAEAPSGPADPPGPN
jgi:hypothetical protein